MSKRLNLRDFQQKLSERLREESTTAHHLSTLGVQVGTEHWLVDMADIIEVLPMIKPTHLPLCKPWVVGMVNVRGNLYCVADMGMFFAQRRSSGETQNRILLVAEKYQFNAALLVERVFGLRDIEYWRYDPLQGCYFDENNVMWRKLDVPGLLEQSDFLQIGV